MVLRFDQSKTIFAGNTFSARFCVNTGEKPLERISMRPAGVSLVCRKIPALPVNPSKIISL